MASTDTVPPSIQLGYSLGTKCLTEFLGTLVGIYLGCSVVANALLPGAKGQSMGFGWIALGYGLAFAFPGIFFGHVSANLNPAMCLADWILGDSDVSQFFALSASEMAGAFVGGVLVWLHWLPHFKTVPEPPAANAADNLLRKRDALPKAAVEISSYNPNPTGPAAAAAAAAQQAQLTSGGPGNTTLRRRRTRTGTGVLSTSGSMIPGGGNVNGAAAASGSIPGSGLPGVGAGAGAADDDKSVVPTELEEVMRLPGKAAKKFRKGLVGTVKEWLADFAYYAIHQDRYHAPADWRDRAAAEEQRSGVLHSQSRTGLSNSANIPGSPAEVARYQSLFNEDDPSGTGRGPLSTVAEDEETGQPSEEAMARRRRRAVFGRAGSGVAGGGNQQNAPWVVEDDTWKSDMEDRSVTRSVLARTYQQETLENRIKLLAPGLYYTSAAIGAAPTAPLASTSGRFHSGQLPSVSPILSALPEEGGDGDDPQLPAPPNQKPSGPPELTLPSSPEFGKASTGGQDGAAGTPASVSPFDSLSHKPFPAGEDGEKLPTTGPLAAVVAAGTAAADGAKPGVGDSADSGSGGAGIGGPARPVLLHSATLTRQDLAAAGIAQLTAAGAPPGAGGNEVAAAAAAVAMNALDEERMKVMALYQAAIIADQNAKLSVFTTRPAIFAPPFNWLTEFMATVMLVTGIKLMSAQLTRQGLPGQALQPLYVGFFIVTQVVGLGGPTGFSVNAARDLGPRIAHALLPIPNKGPSEWYYAWIPVTASLAGGAVGAALFMAINGAIR